jgi:hypothetical protein
MMVEVMATNNQLEAAANKTAVAVMVMATATAVATQQW